MQVYAQIIQADAQFIVGNIQLLDLQGNLLVEIEGFRAQSLETAINLSPERLDRALYELEWHLKERSPENNDTDASRTPATGGWIILSDRSGVGEALTHYLDQQGEHYVIVSPSDTQQLSYHDRQYALNPNQPEQYQQLFKQLTEQGPFSRIIHLWGLDSTFNENADVHALEREQEFGVLAVMYLTQTLAQSGWSQMPRLWLVTRGAQVVGEVAGKVAIAQAPLWGLGRVIGHQEFSHMWGGLIDLDPLTTKESFPLLFQELSRPTDEDQIAFRKGQRFVVRMVAASTHLTPALPASFRPDGSYIITGGLGNLGLLVARWMVKQGARRLILMGRTPLPPRSDWYELAADHPQKMLVQNVQELETQGANVHLAALDIADEDQLSSFLAEYKRQGWPPIRGVIHTAGVVQDELLLRMKKETFQRVLRPKLRGGWLLHQLLKEAPLDFFILFSSIGSVIASLGQGNYASANAFLDALAQYRRAQGLPALSIGWGPWSIGMVEQLQLEQFYARRGIELITPEIGTQILGRVQGQSPAHLAVISANWAMARETSPLGSMPPMFALLEEQDKESSTAESAEETVSLLAQLGDVQENDRHEFLAAHLQDLIARVMQLDPTQFSSQESLSSLGMDSMMAVEVKRRIDRSLKVDISVLELLQGMSIAQLSTRLLASYHWVALKTVRVENPLLKSFSSC
jgi:NADP-dependent 3-hydroxy acid dehydrogenase YdfG/acyl carrier protein